MACPGVHDDVDARREIEEDNARLAKEPRGLGQPQRIFREPGVRYSTPEAEPVEEVAPTEVEEEPVEIEPEPEESEEAEPEPEVQQEVV
jgi:hypothetical protein